MGIRITAADRIMSDISKSENLSSTGKGFQMHYIIRVVKEIIDGMNLVDGDTKRCFMKQSKKSAEEYYDKMCELYKNYRVEMIHFKNGEIKNNGVEL